MFYKVLRPFIEDSRAKEFKRGQIIYNEGDNPESLYLIEEGLVGLFHIGESGKESFLRVFGKDCIFGHRSYFAEEPYHGTSMALSPVKFQILSKDQANKIFLQHPELLKDMTKILARDLGAAELRMSGLQDKSAGQRIIESLIFLKYKYPDQVWTRKEIAEYSGTTFETVTRLMSKLDEENLIEKKGRDFSIVDDLKLLNYSESLV